MARKKDLGGLAALAGLAYMASRDKAAEPEKEYRSDPFGAMTQEERDARPDINGRTLAEENYGNEGRRSIRAPMSTPSVGGTRPAASSRISVDDEAGMSRGTRPRDPRDAEAGMSRGTRRTSIAGAGRGSVNPATVSQEPDMSAYVPRRTPGRLTDVNRPGTNVRYENEDVYKKGGKVKGWGSARGARKAKIY